MVTYLDLPCASRAAGFADSCLVAETRGAPLVTHGHDPIQPSTLADKCCSCFCASRVCRFVSVRLLLPRLSFSVEACTDAREVERCKQPRQVEKPIPPTAATVPVTVTNETREASQEVVGQKRGWMTFAPSLGCDES